MKPTKKDQNDLMKSQIDEFDDQYLSDVQYAIIDSRLSSYILVDDTGSCLTRDDLLPKIMKCDFKQNI